MIGAFMRRSREIPACALLLAASGAMLGCRPQRKDCVDSYGFKQPESYCSSGVHGGAHYVYGGSGGVGYGDRITGGRSTAGSGISRGGFGSEGSHGGGE